MLVVEPVQASIWHCLNHYAYRDATFLAERLRAENETEESLFLVATCYYRAGKIDQAYHVLHTAGARSPQTKFLLARCAADLKKFSEAETVLRSGSVGAHRELGSRNKSVTLEEMVEHFEDKAAFALQILSQILHRSERTAKGVEADKKALKLNPLLWQSYENICSAGTFLDPSTVWDSDCLDNLSHITGSNPLVNLLNTGAPSHPAPASDPKPRHIPSPLQTPITDCDPAKPSVKLSDRHDSSISFISGPGSLNMGLGAPETPLLHCNSISIASTGAPLSGISCLNVTENDQDQSVPSNRKPPNYMPPPLKPKRACSYVPRFGVLSPKNMSPVSGVVAKLVLEFSPQVVLLSPAPPTPHPPAFPGVIPGSPLTAHSMKGLSMGHVHTPGAVTTVAPLRSSTPGVQPAHHDSDPRPNIVKRVAMASKADHNIKPPVLAPSHTTANVITPSAANIQPTRRSSRLFGTQSVKENSKTPNKARIKSKSKFQQSNRHLSENELNEKNIRDSILKPEKDILKPEKDFFDMTDPLKQFTPIANKHNQAVSLSSEAMKIQKASVTGLLSLFKQLGSAFAKLASYDCREAEKLLNALPPRQLDTSWVLSLLGKCHFELAEYKEASKLFKKVREADPFRLQLQEYFSTALWHLQDEVELSALAQDLQRIDRAAPETLCAAGNCFSHQKEHENAIKFFQRAIQVSPDFAYAYTLLGHEYVLVEELDKAMSCFRTAVRLESRHYNAWYGIGLIFYKQERFKFAELYYRKALSINPYSPVLMCHVAVVQHALNNTAAALETLNMAVKVSPKNPLCKFERASILHSVQRYDEALEELDQLKQIVPKESPVFFLIGKVHNQLGNTHSALMHFSWAMDLDPKGANSQIKDALDPALSRAGQDLGLNDSQEGDLEPMLAENSHEDYQGEISDAFDPPAGENIISPESPQGVRTGGGGGLVLNDSDDSL